MLQETLIHIDQSLDAVERDELLKKMCKECGGSEPRKHAHKEHLMFISFDDSKVALHDLPHIARRHGASIEILDF